MNGGIQLEFLRLVIAAIREYYEQWGEYPSPEKLRAILSRPGG